MSLHRINLGFIVIILFYLINNYANNYQKTIRLKNKICSQFYLIYLVVQVLKRIM